MYVHVAEMILAFCLDHISLGVDGGVRSLRFFFKYSGKYLLILHFFFPAVQVTLN